MRLSSQSSSFIFNLPSDFVRPELINSYQAILEKNWVQYENIIDYINSTIKSVNFPGISIDLPKQILARGKERNFKPAKNVQDITTTHELTITFRSVDSDLNYWLLFDMITKHYLDLENSFLNPFTLTCVDIHRDAIYVIRFYEIILKSLSDNTFNYSQQKVTSKDFTMSFNYNFYDIEFLFSKEKILEDITVPTIINNNVIGDNYLVSHWKKKNRFFFVVPTKTNFKAKGGNFAETSKRSIKSISKKFLKIFLL